MNPRLAELLREYWILTAEFDHSFYQAERQKGARLKAVEDEIGQVAREENRCTFCLSDLGGKEPEGIWEGICGDCYAEAPH